MPPNTAFSFLSAAADAGEHLVIHFGNASLRCIALPTSQDARNGDISFEVLKWVERSGLPVAGMLVNIYVRQQGAIHDFVSTVVHSGMDYVVLSQPQFVRKVQRRAWVRVAVDPDAWVRVRDMDGVRRRKLVDLSAGGIGIVAQEGDDDLVVGQFLGRLEFALDYSMFVQRGQVRRASEMDTRTGPVRVVGVEFDKVEPLERDRLVAWVLRRERAAVLERRRDRLDLMDLARGGRPR